MAPAYGRVLRKFALDAWYGRADKADFIDAADRFRRRYEADLMAHYRKVGYPFRPAQIRAEADAWLADQVTLADKVEEVAAEKKDTLAEELDVLRAGKIEEVKFLLSGKPEGRVSPVVSFSRNFEDKAVQMGEEAAFDLAKEINHAVVSGMGDVYRWTSQEDKVVRKTHRRLNGKLFTYSDPPTTIDEYGRAHTGNPGSDWGCRCIEVPAKGRPLRNYTVRA